MLEQAVLEVAYQVVGGDFSQAGDGASRLKRVLQQIGLAPALSRRIAVAAYEAELNIVIHAYSGVLKAKVSPIKVEVWAEDQGPGIPDVELAMQEGYSTAPDHVRALGFGAGMGLPNMRRNADELEIKTVLGEGTVVYMCFANRA
jgi:anti-sigma regulatory factor (Ser/Thr protein kinase)